MEELAGESIVERPRRKRFRMRIALTKSTLRVPPTYFALSHAERLAAEHEFRFFALAADIRDDSVTLPVSDFVPFRALPFRRRELLIPLVMPVMARALRRYRPDLIHQHFATWSAPAVSASASSGIPMLTTVHGADVVVLGKPPATAMLRWHQRNVHRAAGQSRRILAVSRYLADRAIGAGFDAAKVRVHYQGTDTDFFTPGGEPAGHGPMALDAPGLDAHCGAPQILFVGVLNEQKGIRDLLDMSQKLIRGTEHRLVVVGDGPLREEIRVAAAGLPHITMLGRVGREGIRAQMRAATVLVAPSTEYRDAREAAGLVLLEAQACGTPVVAYDSGGLGEMMADGRTGVLVPEGDRVRLGQEVSRVLGLSGADYRRISRAARDFVVAERSLDRSCTELGAHYRDVAGAV